jgi:hypothetical protein
VGGGEGIQKGKGKFSSAVQPVMHLLLQKKLEAVKQLKMDYF